MSLLTIISDASAICGLGTVSTAYASDELTVQQMVAMAQQEGDELSRYHDWRRLKFSATITGDGVSEVFDLPVDFDRFLAGETMWLDDSPALPLIGPVTDSEFLALQAAEATPSRPVWRLFDDQVEFYPPLQDGEVVLTEYRTAYWIENGSTLVPRFTADANTTLLPERLITLGVIWRWKQQKGLNYAEDFRTYEKAKLQAASKDGGQGIIKARECFKPSGRVSDVQVIPYA